MCEEGVHARHRCIVMDVRSEMHYNAGGAAGCHNSECSRLHYKVHGRQVVGNSARRCRLGSTAYVKGCICTDACNVQQYT